MRFRIATRDLKAVNDTVSKALSSHSSIPILEGIYMEAIGKEVLFKCTDLSLQIETIVSADVEEEGGVVLPGRLFMDIVRHMPGEETCISVQKQKASIESGKAFFTLQGDKTEDYHSMPMVKREATVKIGMDEFRSMIRQSIFATAQDEAKPILTGVLAEITREKLTMVALDGYRLAMISRAVEGSAEQNAVIPARSLLEIGRILSDEDRPIQVIFSRTHVLLDLGGTKITTRLLDGDFIKYRQILPKDHLLRVRVNRAELLEGIERAALIARSEKSNLIRFQFDKDTLELSANSETGRACEELEVNCIGDPLLIAFNARYFSDVLKALDEEYVFLDMNNGVSPCVIRPIEGDGFYYLVLPVRLFA